MCGKSFTAKSFYRKSAYGCWVGTLRADFAVLLFLAGLGDAVMVFSVVLCYWIFFVVGAISVASGLFGICLFHIKKQKMARRIHAVGVPVLIGLVALASVVFMFSYLHQVQTKQTFQVSVSWFDTRVPGEYGWAVHIEQRTLQELKNASVQSDGGGTPFPSMSNPKTADGHAQQEFSCYPQPRNVTIVWDGGSETFIFNHYPFEGLDSGRMFNP